MNKMIKYYQNSNSHIMESVAFEFDVSLLFSSYVRMWDGLIKLFLMFVIGNQHTWPNHPEAHLSTHTVCLKAQPTASAVPCSVSFTAPLLQRLGTRVRLPALTFH